MTDMLRADGLRPWIVVLVAAAEVVTFSFGSRSVRMHETTPVLLCDGRLVAPKDLNQHCWKAAKYVATPQLGLSLQRAQQTSFDATPMACARPPPPLS